MGIWCILIIHSQLTYLVFIDINLHAHTDITFNQNAATITNNCNRSNPLDRFRLCEIVLKFRQSLLLRFIRKKNQKQ